MNIAIASDHAGFPLKNVLVDYVTELGHSIDDLGCYSTQSTDYPIYAEKLCRAIVAGQYERGILVCGTGIGVSIAANKIPGIRAALCADCYSAEMSREHNDANVLCLGGRTLGGEIITIGSDAHRPQDAAKCLAEGQEILKECGFKYIAVFTKRKPSYIPL